MANLKVGMEEGCENPGKSQVKILESQSVVNRRILGPKISTRLAPCQVDFGRGGFSGGGGGENLGENQVEILGSQSVVNSGILGPKISTKFPREFSPPAAPPIFTASPARKSTPPKIHRQKIHLAGCQSGGNSRAA